MTHAQTTALSSCRHPLPADPAVEGLEGLEGF